MKTKIFIIIVLLNSFIFNCYSQIDSVYENVNLKSFELLNYFNETKNNHY
jgi:hypothetical protein